VLSRPDFKLNDSDTFHSAKIVLQSIKSIIQFHTSYLCGNPVSITGDNNIVAMLQSVYKKGFYSKHDMEIVQNLVKFGNSYEYVYKENGVVKSKILNNDCVYPIYENGEYVGLLEKWNINPLTDDTYIREYLPKTVSEYKNGILTRTYRNSSGLPIHYRTVDRDNTDIFGVGIVKDLILIQDQIEELLSKVSDAVVNLSTNPVGVLSGNRLQQDETINSDITGAVMNIDSDGKFSYATANLDYQSIKLLLDNLINQFWTIAAVPSSLFGQNNIANISSVSLEMLYNNSDAYAKLLGISMQDGFMQRLEYISKLINMDVTGVTISFNLNRPTDNSAMVDSLINLYNNNLISRESAIRQSPYSIDVNREMKQIEADKQSDVVNTTK
jgi:hypothetical protein